MAEYDSPWKEAIPRFFRPLMDLCFPRIAAEIDWAQGFEFIETELQEQFRNDSPGRLHVDKLVQVTLRSGEPRLILLHLEVQHWPEGNFPERLYSYHVRVGQRGLPVVTVAILADNDPNWRPHRYEWELLGCRVVFDFPTCKLLDLVENQAEMERLHSAPAVLILANWAAQQTRADARERFKWKLRLMRRCISEGFSREDITELYRFIDWVIDLPRELEQEFQSEIRRSEDLMQYVTSFERSAEQRGREEGREEGRLEGRLEGLLVGQILTYREILGLPELPIEEITRLSREELQAMLEGLKREVADHLKA